jgi:hypothetical protein
VYGLSLQYLISKWPFVRNTGATVSRIAHSRPTTTAAMGVHLAILCIVVTAYLDRVNIERTIVVGTKLIVLFWRLNAGIDMD